MSIKCHLIIVLCNLLPFQMTLTAYGQNKYEKTKVEMANLRKLAAAVESDPNNEKAHSDYIAAMNIHDPMLAQQYSIWMNRFPKCATIPFAIGKSYEDYHDIRGKEDLLKAVNLNPDLAEAWEYLSFNSLQTGDKQLAIEYMQHATQSAPQNADYAFYLAHFYRDGDPAKYDSLMLNIAYRFPNNDRGAEALQSLASDSFNENEKMAYYEVLYKLYSKQQTPWFRMGMKDYYNYLLNTSPDKAFELALKMVLEIKINRLEWKQKAIVARSFIEAHKLLDANKPVEASEILKQVNLGNSKTMGIQIDAEETLSLLRAEADDKGNKTRVAYDSLVHFYSKQPSDRLREKMKEYAAKIGIDSLKVDSDIWKMRNNGASKEINFTLENLADHKQVSLSDYRGKVVLLTYWFPTCGPCGDEFQYFESALKKVNNKNVAYLAININKPEDPSVMPLIANSRYTFVPLADDSNKKNNLPPMLVAPTNFLIDQKGRIIFTDFQINGKNERSLELMISELLKYGNTPGAP